MNQKKNPQFNFSKQNFSTEDIFFFQMRWYSNQDMTPKLFFSIEFVKGNYNLLHLQKC